MTHAADERNYHVFYEMLKGLRPEEKERYGLTAADNYFYLNQVRLGGERRDPRKKKSGARASKSTAKTTWEFLSSRFWERKNGLNKKRPPL